MHYYSTQEFGSIYFFSLVYHLVFFNIIYIHQRRIYKLKEVSHHHQPPKLVFFSKPTKVMTGSPKYLKKIPLIYKSKNHQEASNEKTWYI